MRIYNQDCIQGSKEHLKNESIDLFICDPPFGINETSFHKHYKRDEKFVLDGYVEAPDDYYQFSVEWLKEAKRAMKQQASLYVISGWSNLRHILNAIETTELHTINHLIWKFNFGLMTKTKFISSHYHILYLKKKKTAKPTFNTYCRFGAQEKSEKGGSLLAQDLDDVFAINKEYQPSIVKNKNKLPDALIEKLILYSSNEGDSVCDFFLGNFTTAIAAKKLGRLPWGFELNPEGFDHHVKRLEAVKSGERLEHLREVKNYVPPNQGKPITTKEAKTITDEFKNLLKGNKTKKAAIEMLGKKYGRGRFGIKNIIDRRAPSTNKQGNRRGRTTDKM